LPRTRFILFCTGIEGTAADRIVQGSPWINPGGRNLPAGFFILNRHEREKARSTLSQPCEKYTPPYYKIMGKKGAFCGKKLHIMGKSFPLRQMTDKSIFARRNYITGRLPISA